MIGLASYSLLLALLAAATLSSPAVALAGILCMFGLEQWGASSNAWLAQHNVVTNLAVGVLVLAGLGVRLARRECLLCRWTPANTAVFALYGYACCTLAWTPDLDVVLDQWRKHTPYIFTILVAAPLLVSRIVDVRRALAWTVVVGAALCALALVLGHWGARGLILYGSALEAETNALAIASMGGSVLIAAALSLQGQQSLLRRALYLAAIPLALGVILRSGSRGQLIAAALAVMAGWPLAYRQKNVGSFVLWMGGVAAVAGIGWWVTDYVTVDSLRWTSEQTSGEVGGRLSDAFALLRQSAASPITLLFGLGNSSAFHYLGHYPHVTPLEVLAEEGVVGILLYVGILFIACRSIARLLRRLGNDADSHSRAAVAVLGALFLFEFVLTIKQGQLLSSYFMFVYVLLLNRLEALAVSEAIVTEPARAFPPVLHPNLLR